MGLIKNAEGAEIDDRYFKAAGRDFNVGPYPRWIARRMYHSDFTAASTSEAVVAFKLKAHTIIHDVGYLVEEDFTGTSWSAATIALGPSGGDVDAILEESDVFTGVTNDALLTYNTLAQRGVSLWDPTAGDEHSIVGHDIGATDDTEYDITLVSTGGNLNVSTAGRFVIYLVVSNPLQAFVSEQAGE